jgi:hypothetical protein
MVGVGTGLATTLSVLDVSPEVYAQIAAIGASAGVSLCLISYSQ